MFIVFDFDNTLCNSSAAIISLYNLKYNKKIPNYIDVSWNFEELPCITKEDIKLFFSSKDFFEILEPNKGMKELVQNLCDKGHRVKIVSYSYEESKQYKIKYIKKHFPKVEYEILTHDKSLVLDKRDAIDKKVDLCIDDSLEALKLSDAKIKILYGCTKYNRENDSYIRVVNAKELKEVIDNFNILKNLGVKF